METIIGLNLDHHDTCLFTKSMGGEGLPEFNQFIHKTLNDAVHLVALRLEDQEYQYATISAYSPTLSDPPLQFEQLELTEWPSNETTEGTSQSGFEVVYSTRQNTEIRKTLHLPCFLHNTHSANEDFCGREDILERIAAELLPSKNTVTASGTALQQIALCGFGGIGKTEIAREFSRRHKASYDAVFWVAADNISKLAHHYQQISLALGLEDPSECKNQVVSREIVKGWLSNPRKYLSGADDSVQPGQARSGPTWLLIFDNADEPMILADYWPQGSGLDLGPLTQQDSLSLYNNLTSIFNEPEGDIAQRFSDALGGVPLAISQMAGIIR
ncbi:uncharacterized protein RCO7_00500 [Rhynchosporium graminicola]|uniref:NB-ARC domain-containing protein n=1 Tax=Rhynchosporium graminicola TaxID=2792576 RepID=A0A1E1KMG4_9HELO|nr:uncharacterized protein RCO7_00500 [Rhynchosporium commune]